MPHGPKFEPHPQSVPGDFYVEKGQCLACGVPHVVAPDLVGWAEGKTSHCIWKKQPSTPAEVERAIAVLDAQELECHRYAGTDPSILNRVLSGYCDYPLPTGGVESIAEEPSAPTFALLELNSGFMLRALRRIFGHKRS